MVYILFFINKLVTFSLITVTFQAQDYLAQMLESVAAQDFSNFEHIIWDGGSTDKTLDIVQSFPHTALYRGQDRGIADAMNQASRFAKGKFLLYLHADDLLAHPRVLSLAATSLKQHPTVQWLYGRAHIIDEVGNRLRTTNYERFSLKRLAKYNFITHPSTFISHQLFQKAGGFREQWRYCMDYDLWLRVALFCEPLVLPTPLASFRQHVHSLSTSHPLEVADEAYKVRNQYITSPWNRYRSYRTWKKRRRNEIHKKNGPTAAGSSSC
ncbi:MAG: glycosyltransferase family 2 protein [Chlamydiales bacterium]